jgi:2-keto-4-pentenoate hydratase/2-oxohepta-3-ene-1,7-dioic acid hydratase in catechol pathway
MKILCVGRNYAKHIEELKNAVPDEPVIFFKPDTAVVRNNRDFYYPEYSKEIHYECELVLRFGKEGKYISEEFARTYIDGVGLGIDFTARDLQDKAKANGLPWALAKGFNDSAPVSDFLPVDDFPDFQSIQFTCHINGEERQNGNSSHMLWPVASLIAYVSQFVTFKKGDMLFTGTPAGVGEVKVGDHVEGFLEGKKMLNFHVK